MNKVIEIGRWGTLLFSSSLILSSCVTSRCYEARDCDVCETACCCSVKRNCCAPENPCCGTACCPMPRYCGYRPFDFCTPGWYMYYRPN